jgi:FAD/FMN-containing dehydrogenase
MTYRMLQTLYDGLFPKGRDRCYWKSTYLTHLDDDAIAVITRWLASDEDHSNIGWVRDAWCDMQRYSTGRMYLNFPGLGEGDNLVRAAFGDECYARLQTVKRRYDPENIFRMNQNIVPL